MSRIIENLNLQRGLLRHLDTFPDIQLLDKTKVQTITPDEGATGSWPVLHLDSGRSIRARLLVCPAFPVSLAETCAHAD